MSSGEGKIVPDPDARLAAANRALTISAILGGAILLLAHARLSGCTLRPVAVERPAAFLRDYRVDPNSAHAAELALLPGIGETLAARIIADRESNGPFRTVGELRRVRGIGAKTLERVRPYVEIGSDDSKPVKERNKRKHPAQQFPDV